MMKESLDLEIKKSIGYSETVKFCENCAHCTEDENPFVDRMWDYHCHYSKLGSFKVKARASCNKFKPKQ